MTQERDADWLAEVFESHRAHLNALSYRMLGSRAEAEEAVQDAWLRVSRASAEGIDNIGGWLTTIVARVCLNLLRARETRRERPVGVHLPDAVVRPASESGPEMHALVADSVGLALQVVLDSLTPDERLAFVLHDLFGVPFDQIAPLIDRSPAAARQLASRARRRVRGADLPAPDPDRTRHREVVNAFFAAATTGDMDRLVSLLHPDVVLRSDGGTLRLAATQVLHGIPAVAGRATTFSAPGAVVHPALVNGTVGVVVTIEQHPVSVMSFVVTGGRIVEIQSLVDPERLAHIDLTGVLT